jgi:hypothetical protein
VIAIDEREEKVSTVDEGRSPQLNGNGADVSQAAHSILQLSVRVKGQRNMSCPNPEFQNPVTKLIQFAEKLAEAQTNTKCAAFRG